MAYQQSGPPYPPPAGAATSPPPPFQPAFSQPPQAVQPQGAPQQYAPSYMGQQMLPPQRSNMQSMVPAVNNSPSFPPHPPASTPQQSFPQSTPATSMTAALPTSAPPVRSPPVAQDASSQKGSASPKTTNLSPHQQDQVNILFELNECLLRELAKLQSIGAATQTTTSPSPQLPNAQSNSQNASDNTRDAQKSPTGTNQTPSSSTPTPAPQTPKATKPSGKQIYDNYLKRMQLSIALLLAISQGKQTPPFPPIMEPPPISWFLPGPGDSSTDDEEQKSREAFNEIKRIYTRMKELWPNYANAVRQAQQQRSLEMQQQQAQQHAQQSTGEPRLPASMGQVRPQQSPT